MIITINTTARVINTGLETVADTINVFKPDCVSGKDLIRAKNQVSKNQSGRGAGYSYNYETNGYASYFIEIDDEAIMMALPLVVKIAKAVNPIISMGVAMINSLSNLKDLFHGIGIDFTTKFQRRFGKEKTYAVASILNEDLKLADVVVVEDDGFDNWNLIHTEHCWDIHDMDIIMRLFTAAYHRGEAMKDNKTLRYPIFTFEKITKDEAIDRAIKMRPALQADVDGITKTEAAQ